MNGPQQHTDRINTRKNAYPATSLVIATYNWPQALELCLLSVLQQEVLPMEVVIADDGSTAETQELVERFREQFPIPLKHIWQPDEGFQLSRIRNKAMAAAEGDYLVQIDGDLVLHPLFIKDHMAKAKPGHFIGGSRVLLDAALSAQALQQKQVRFSMFTAGIKNRFNAMHIPGLAAMIEQVRKEKGLYNLRGCNMSFWKKDIIAVNGYNENIRGWGREDTELVIRLYNAGVNRSFFKLQGIVYHLYHKENERNSLAQNDGIMQLALNSKSTFCSQGIDQYL